MSSSSLRSDLRTPQLLKYALLGDAVLSGAAGLLLVFAAAALAPRLGLPESLLFYAGASLLPFAAFVAWLGTRAPPQRGAVWAVVAYNAMWTVDSILLLASGWFAPTNLGIVFVLAQAIAVGVFAELQVTGLRRALSAAA